MSTAYYREEEAPQSERITFRTLHPHDGRFCYGADGERLASTLDRRVTVSVARVAWPAGQGIERVVDWRVVA